MNASEVGEGAGAGVRGGGYTTTDREDDGGGGGSAGAASRSGDTFDHDPSRFKGAQEPRLGAERAD